MAVSRLNAALNSFSILFSQHPGSSQKAVIPVEQDNVSIAHPSPNISYYVHQYKARMEKY